MRTRSSIVAIVAVVVVGAVALAVLLFDPGGDRPGRDGILEITVQDYSLTPAAFTVPAGEAVRLIFVSENEFTQNLTIGRSEIEEGGRPIGFQEDLLADLEVRVDPSSAWIAPTSTFDTVTLSVKPGASVTLDVTLPEDRVGVWQIGCYLGNSCDYRVGPAGEMTVE
jgi:hypothetical protein